MKASWKDTIIAETDDTVVVEGNHYFARQGIAERFFTRSDHTTYCPWKGTARYLNVVVDGEVNENAAWYYPDPKEAAAEIKDRIAFWNGVAVA